jgi:hypothetical protein
MKDKITNPIFFELLKLKIINKEKIIKLSNSTRDKRIPVFQDTKSKVIFLGKYETNFQYYKTIKYNDKDRILKKTDKKIRLVKTFKENIKTPMIEDDKRRVIQHNSILKSKRILDFGCGWGGF